VQLLKDGGRAERHPRCTKGQKRGGKDAKTRTGNKKTKGFLRRHLVEDVPEGHGENPGKVKACGDAPTGNRMTP